MSVFPFIQPRGSSSSCSPFIGPASVPSLVARCWTGQSLARSQHRPCTQKVLGTPVRVSAVDRALCREPQGGSGRKLPGGCLEEAGLELRLGQAGLSPEPVETVAEFDILHVFLTPA